MDHSTTRTHLLPPSDGECRLVRAQLGLQRSSAAKLFPPTEPRATVPGVRPDWTDRPSRLSDSSVVLRGPRTRCRATHRSRLQLLCAYSLDQNVGIPIDLQAGRRRNNEALDHAPGRNPQGGGGGCMSKGSDVGFYANGAHSAGSISGCQAATRRRPAASSARSGESPAAACPPGPPPRPSAGCPRLRRLGCARPTSSA